MLSGISQLLRSEEHTSELQSRLHLVCRLLLECYRSPRTLHPFPTRRSSDLVTAPLISDGSGKFTQGGAERHGSTSAFRMSDYLGSTTKIVNSSQAVSDTRQYDAFGNLTAA